jgi:hypothetical protein
MSLPPRGKPERKKYPILEERLSVGDLAVRLD